MSKTPMRLVRVASLAALLVAAPAVAAFAQDAAAPAPANATAPAAEAPANSAAPAPTAPVDPNAVVAKVGDQTITEADLTFAAEDMAQDLSQMPPDERRAFLVRILVDMKVMSEAARAQGMDKTEIFAQRLKYLEERALRRAYFNDEIAKGITEEAARAEYDKFVAAFKPQEEVHASHILVESEDKAKELKAELDKGADFATLAKANSIDPGKDNGGDLGFFAKGQMVPEFETAAFALKNPGDISEPVKSQFGWHIIKLDEKRESSPPTFEQVAPQIQQQLLMRAFTEKVAGLMKDQKVEISDPALKAKFDAQEAAENNAAAGAAATE